MVGLAGAVVFGCTGQAPDSPVPAAGRPSILLVTLDTTRADAIGPEAAGIETPAFNAVASRGRRYRQAYATAPETVPAHSAMMTGLYPAGHGVHENGRSLSSQHPVLAGRLKDAGYRTAAFVSAFVLSRRFGLARGFDIYDDSLPAGGSERTSRETTDQALAYLATPSTQPLFLWVHYFDPHAPYAAAEPFGTRFAARPYLGEVAAMDDQLGRLVAAFEQRAPGPRAMGRGGRSRGGTRRPRRVAARAPPVSIDDARAVRGGRSGYRRGGCRHAGQHAPRVPYRRRSGWARWRHPPAAPEPEVVIGEAMKPFLEYGWQPQIMAVLGRQKAIFAGKFELYDLAADSAEQHDQGRTADVPRALRAALDDYPVPSADTARQPDALTPDAKQKLASLGYVSAGAAPVVRKDAPRPADMTHLFDRLEQASGLFVRGEYARVIPVLERILADDPTNLDATLRLATAHSSLRHDPQALSAFKRAAALAPRSPDVRLYLGLHYARGSEWARAVPLLEQAVAEMPDRLPALEALAAIRVKQGRPRDAIALLQKVYALRAPAPNELIQLGQLAMGEGDTGLAIQSFEEARRRQGSAFAGDLELGVLYLAARRFEDARAALDRIPPSHPEYPMALFKRAQVSVLLNEPDRAARIALARQRADQTTRGLIEKERLFQNVRTP